ncbi:hypothetical protein CR970_03830 [Candidatus Saccharibacteria bacterium]|nr:MAG: hypothetical protein CR970_03830 [Candidatus Saccharibacteria bacterium]
MLVAARATTDGDKPEESGGISIQIEMPNISWGRPSWLLTLPSYTRAQIRSAGLACLVALVLGVGLRVGLGMTPYGEKIGLKDHSGGGDSAELARPDYQPVVPGDKSNLATPADGEAGYDDVRDLYSYKDTFANANIVVAQQPLPDDLASDADRLSKVAAAIGADKPFETAFGAAYHSSADEAGDQRVVAVYQDRLLLIQSDKRFDSEDWQYYIESLR